MGQHPFPSADIKAGEGVGVAQSVVADGGKPDMGDNIFGADLAIQNVLQFLAPVSPLRLLVGKGICFIVQIQSPAVGMIHGVRRELLQQGRDIFYGSAGSTKQFTHFQYLSYAGIIKNCMFDNIIFQPIMLIGKRTEVSAGG